MFGDRRIIPRFPCLLFGEARPAGIAAFEVVCTSICRGGGFFACRNVISPGTPMTVVFRPHGADGPIIECAAESVWLSGKGGVLPPGFGARWRSLRCTKGDDVLRAFAAEHLRWIDLPPLPTDADGRAWLRLTPDGKISRATELPLAPVHAEPQVAPEPAPARASIALQAPIAVSQPTTAPSFAPFAALGSAPVVPAPVPQAPVFDTLDDDDDNDAPNQPATAAGPLSAEPPVVAEGPPTAQQLSAIAQSRFAGLGPAAASPSAPQPVARPGLMSRPTLPPLRISSAQVHVTSRGTRLPAAAPDSMASEPPPIPDLPPEAYAEQPHHESRALPGDPHAPSADQGLSAGGAPTQGFASLFDASEEGGPTVALDPEIVREMLRAAMAAASPQRASGEAAGDDGFELDTLQAESTEIAQTVDSATRPHYELPVDLPVAAPALPDVSEDSLADLLAALDNNAAPQAASAVTPTGWGSVATPQAAWFGSSWGQASAETLAAPAGTPQARDAQYRDPPTETASRRSAPHPIVAPAPLADHPDSEQQAILTEAYHRHDVPSDLPAAIHLAADEFSADQAESTDPTMDRGEPPLPPTTGKHDSQLVAAPAVPARAPKSESTIASVRQSKPKPTPVERSAAVTPVPPRSANSMPDESTVTLLPGAVHPVLDSWPAGVPRALASRYEQLQRIGQGGHGVVFRGVDKMLDRFVVLKFLLQSALSTEMARKYFMREVRLSASLNHPNIVHIYDSGNADGVLWYAMEFVDGVTLAQYLPPNQPIHDLAFLFSAFSQLCEALDSAHGQGILHRDVKPDNALVSHDGAVKLFDFGLARIADQGFGDQSLLLGTPFYMAPEQLTGGKVDHRADIYALGVLLYRMLSGELPFRDGNIFAAHVLEPVPDPRRFNPALNEATVVLLMRMLAKQADQRPSACRGMAVDLWSALFGH